MHAGKSKGLAGRFSTVALIAGVALLLVAGAFAAEVFMQSASQPSTTISTQPPTSTQVSTPTSSSEGESTSIGSATSTSATSSSSTQSRTTSSTSTSSTSSTSTTTATTTTSTQPGTVQIFLPVDVGNNESLNFTPSKITVVIGVNNTIVWNDLDYVQHTVQSVIVPSGATPWKSGILNEGQLFSVTLTVPGNYKYDCSIHPDWMVGTIQVLR